MSYDKMARLVQRLSRVTAERSDLWEPTTENGVFQASFPNYAVRIDSRPGDNYQNEDDVYLSIYDDDGALIEEVADSDLGPLLPDAYRVMVSLYESARRQAMGVDQALDEILSELGPDPDPSPGAQLDEDDELPF